MKLLREPLLHFAAAGAILFGTYAWLNDERVDEESLEPVRVGEGDVRWLRQTFTNQWLREPTADELRGLVADMVNEQLLAREAQAMGLEENDTIIRRRLAQKLKFLVEDTAQLAEPTQEELQQFYEVNSARFETPGRISFRQIYFSPEQRKDTAADATAALAALKADGEGSIAEGDRLLLGDDFRDNAEAELSGLFGADFARQVFAIEPGAWSGPVKSGYGLHLVLVTQRTPTRPQPFEAVRDTVLTEWRRDRQNTLGRDYLARLREKYGVEFDESANAVRGIEPAPDLAAR